MQNTHKGSITVEAIVMLGLIATLTPILYKHVSERRQDIENINEANTLLLLKNATAEYIEANKETLGVGSTVLSPADIGVDISGYRIGIRKDSDGTINAMIASAAGGNDMKAAKVAALLGLSAGIYSAQNTAKAWGINGVWAEDISNYGFTSLPTGIPVITTAYDKEDASGLNEEQLKDFIENTGFERVTAKEFCLDNPDIPEEERCITRWNLEKCTELIAECNEGNKCNQAYNLRCNQSCNDIFASYNKEGLTPTSDYAFRLTGSNPDGETNKTKCYFTSSAGYNAYEAIKACNESTAGSCRVGYTYNLNRNCIQLRTSYGSKLEEDKSVSVKFGTSDDSGIATSCWFPSGTTNSYEGEANTFTGCRTNDDYACRALVRGGGYNMCNCQAWRDKGFMVNDEYKMFCAGRDMPYAKQYCVNTAISGVLANNVASGTFTAPETGDYTLSAYGEKGAEMGAGGAIKTQGIPGDGGVVMTTGSFAKGTIFTVVRAAGGVGSYGVKGGEGVGIKAGNDYIIVAGGGASATQDCAPGGGGWTGGGAGASCFWFGGSSCRGHCGPNSSNDASGVKAAVGLSGYNGSLVVQMSSSSWRGGVGGNYKGSVGGTGGDASTSAATNGGNGSPYGGRGSTWAYWDYGNSNTHGGGGGGGSGYCAAGYSCSENANGATVGTARITYDIPVTP